MAIYLAQKATPLTLVGPRSMHRPLAIVLGSQHLPEGAALPPRRTCTSFAIDSPGWCSVTSVQECSAVEIVRDCTEYYYASCEFKFK